MLLETLGLFFVALFVVACLGIAGIAFHDWQWKEGKGAEFAFWSFFAAGIFALIFFSYLSSGATVWALQITPPSAGI